MVRPIVLLVEDDKDLAQLFEDTLRLTRVNTVHVNTGLKAINWLEVNEEAPQLILLDVNMPNLDGRSVYQYIRDKSKFDDTHVVITTSNTLMARRMADELIGDDVLLPKPFQLHELMALGKQVYSKYKARESSGQDNEAG